MESQPAYFRYWGKSAKDFPPRRAQYPGWHLLPWHCLDVAAVGVTYLRQADRLRSFLAHGIGIDPDVLIGLFGYFLALHDLGKFSVRFQAQRDDLLTLLQRKSCSQPYTVRHDSLGYAYWQQCISPQWVQRPALAKFSGRGSECWAAAAMGHHGQPPISAKSAAQGFVLGQHFTSDDQQAAADMPDQRGLAQLTVFGPPAGGEIKEDWYQSFFPKGAAVYPDQDSEGMRQLAQPQSPGKGLRNH